MEPQYVKMKDLPKDATLVGRVEGADAVPLDTAIQGSPRSVWDDGFYDSIKDDLISKAVKEYGMANGGRLALVEGFDSGAKAFDVAGIQYHVWADVYRV